VPEHVRNESVDHYIPEVYEDLRQIARCLLLGEGDVDLLSSGALVHEAYIRLAQLRTMEFANREHFVATSARFMRRVLIDQARARKRRRRGGHLRSVPLREELLPTTDDLDSLLCLSEALDDLEIEHPRPCRVVEARFFLGLTIAETADTLGVSVGTVKGDWRLARDRLSNTLSQC